MMDKYLTASEKISLYKNFDEGTELGDAVRSLLVAASILNSISADHELALVMLTVEKLMRDYMEMARNREFSREEYEEIDPELYSYLLGGAQKVSRKYYLPRYNDCDGYDYDTD